MKIHSSGDKQNLLTTSYLAQHHQDYSNYCCSESVSKPPLCSMVLDEESRVTTRHGTRLCCPWTSVLHITELKLSGGRGRHFCCSKEVSCLLPRTFPRERQRTQDKLAEDLLLPEDAVAKCEGNWHHLTTQSTAQVSPNLDFMEITNWKTPF